MLELKDFYHLPELDPLVEELVAGRSGLVIVAGLDPRPLLADPSAGRFLPSGRSAIWRILLRQFLTAHAGAKAIVVADSGEPLRIPRQLSRRVTLLPIGPIQPSAQAVAEAASRRPGLLAVDRLAPENTAAVLEAAESGLYLLVQLDTVFRGSEVARHLLDLGASPDQIGVLSWVISVQRLPTLCTHCKRPSPPGEAQWAALYRLHPRFYDWLSGSAEADEPGLIRLTPGEPAFFTAPGCALCHGTGREGEVAVFDVFRAGAGQDLMVQPSVLPIEAYLLGLAARGHLALDDVIHFESDQLRRTYRQMAASERALAEANVALRNKLAELESANRLLQQRTEALVSLQGIGQALIASTGLDELAALLCRYACNLCGADRAVLYVLQPGGETAEVLAAVGWDPAPLHEPLDASQVRADGDEPQPFNRRPPGIPRRVTDAMSGSLRAGLRVPLIAQQQQVGLMIVHTSQKLFAPHEVALLQAFANQAALALQRAGLFDALREKIAQLEAAQAELVKKERLERELELARQVQQSVLPRIFPLVPGFRFAARNEPARRVGGDFYDVLLLDADRFGVVIGDVSDKGMPAALYMALSRSLILAEARRAASPGEVLASVHHLLLALGQPHMFVTVFYGVIDVRARRLTYSRAGHDRPILARDGQARFLGGEGTFLGFTEARDLHLTEESMDLLPGDRLVLYTDGLADARAPDGRTFGLDRLVDLIQANGAKPPDDLCAAAFSAVAAHQASAEQFDDMTLLVVEIAPNTP